MLKNTDLTATEVHKSLLQGRKNKAIPPVQFIAPPKDIVEAIKVVINFKNQQASIIKNLKENLEDPTSTNKNALALQLSMMEESQKNLNSMLNLVVQHLVIHKFDGIEILGRQTHPSQPNSHNLIKVSIEGCPHSLFIANKYIDLNKIPYIGIYQENGDLPFNRNLKSDLVSSEAIHICEEYCKTIRVKRAKTKDLNLRISTHNKVLKVVKLRIQQGLTQVIDTPKNKAA